jgi:5-methyltetrahydrofolate--homocysteine methyltransferase
MADLKAISESIINGEAPKVKELVQKALNEGVDPKKILDEGLVAGMTVVGEKFKEGEFFVPEMLISARAMHYGMEIIKPAMVKAGSKLLAKFMIGTVKGDMHDIGKSLVAIMAEGSGFEVIDLGIDVSPEKFVEAVKEKQPQIVGLSALLTTTMTEMQTTIDALKHAGLRDKVKILVGGAPVTQVFADKIGADGYAAEASTAASKAKELVGIK